MMPETWSGPDFARCGVALAESLGVSEPLLFHAYIEAVANKAIAAMTNGRRSLEAFMEMGVSKPLIGCGRLGEHRLCRLPGGRSQSGAVEYLYSRASSRLNWPQARASAATWVRGLLARSRCKLPRPSLLPQSASGLRRPFGWLWRSSALAVATFTIRLRSRRSSRRITIARRARRARRAGAADGGRFSRSRRWMRWSPRDWRAISIFGPRGSD